MRGLSCLVNRARKVRRHCDAGTNSGVFAFTIEFWSLPAAAGVEVKDFISFFRDPPEEASLKMLAWNDRDLNGEGFSPWTPFDHPQLGPVEVGGWKTKFTFQNPPPEFLEKECEKLTRFALSHASTAPSLKADLKTEELSPGLRRLELTVENTGYLPTNVTRIAADKKLIKPVKATLKMPEGTSLVSGELETDLGHLAGRSALVGGGWKGPAFFQGLPSGNAGRYAWVVRGDGPVEIEVWSEKAGMVRLKG